MSQIFSSILKPWVGETRESSFTDDWTYVAANKISPVGEQEDVPSDKLYPTHSLYKKDKGYYLYNKSTGNLYSVSSSNTVALNCLGITFAAPFYTVGKMLYHAVKMICDIAMIIFNKFYTLCKEVSNGANFFSAISSQFRDGCVELSLKSLSHLWEIVRAPYYGLGLFFASVNGWMADPFAAREQIGKIQVLWNYAPREYDVRFGCSKPDRIFHLAICMMPVRNRDKYIDACYKIPSVEILERFDNVESFKSRSGIDATLSKMPGCPIASCCYPLYA